MHYMQSVQYLSLDGETVFVIIAFNCQSSRSLNKTYDF